MKDWSFDEADARVAAELGRAFPRSVFDVHAHLYQRSLLSVAPESVFATGPEEVGPAVWRERVGRQLGGPTLSGGLFLPVPSVPRERIDAANTWLMETTDSLPGSKALALVAPGMTPAQVELLLKHRHLAGFKPYHFFSTRTPTWWSDMGWPLTACFRRSPRSR